MKINKNTIAGLVPTVVLAVVLLTMLPTLIPLASTASSDLFTQLGNNTVSNIGTDASAFALTLPSIMGWLWLIAPIMLVIAVAFGLFGKGGRR